MAGERYIGPLARRFAEQMAEKGGEGRVVASGDGAAEVYERLEAAFGRTVRMRVTAEEREMILERRASARADALEGALSAVADVIGPVLVKRVREPEGKGEDK